MRAIFQLVPLAETIYYSFFEYYRSGLKIIGPNFVGMENYEALFSSNFPLHKISSLHEPILLLHKNIRLIHITNPVSIDPNIKQSFAYKAKNS